MVILSDGKGGGGGEGPLRTDNDIYIYTCIISRTRERIHTSLLV